MQSAIERFRELLSGRRTFAGHFMMPLVKQFCTVQTGQAYGKYSQDYRVLTRCQMQTIERFPIDIFNTLGYPYREAGDLGLLVCFPEDSQPEISGTLIERRQDIDRLAWPDPRRGRLMSDRINAISEFKRLRPDIVAMGACEGPFALANTLMGIERTMMCLYDDPDFLREVMDWIEPHTLAFVGAQIDAGADMIFVGDGLASQISPQAYVDQVLESERRLVNSIQSRGVPVRLHICGNVGGILPHLAGAGARFIDIDFPVDLRAACAAAAEKSPGSFVVGNINPVSVLLRGTPDDVRQACRACERSAEGFDNFILAPGCEVPPRTPPENYQAMIEFGSAFHATALKTR